MVFQIIGDGDLSVTVRLILMIFLPVTVIFSLAAHEFAHGFVSDFLGDPTARRAGRLTLNPLKHIDPLGFLCLMFFGFGWAKPVPVNPRYYANPKKGMAVTAFSGPLVNLFIGIISTVYLALLVWFYETGIITVFPVIGKMSGQVYLALSTGLYIVLYLNIMLAVFNMIPVPPLDGSRLMLAFLPEEKYFRLMRYERYTVLLIFLLLWTGIFNRLFEIIADFVILGVGNTVFYFLDSIAFLLLK